MIYRYLEPFVKVDRAVEAPRSTILGSFEKDRFNWAKKKNIMLVCGHTHRSVFNSKSKIDINKKKIKELQNRLLSNAESLPARGSIMVQIDKLNDEISRERKLGRDFQSLGQEPPPHYFNTGCALYTDGITVIEISNNIIKLVKWHRRATSGNLFSVYKEEKLSEIIDRLG